MNWNKNWLGWTGRRNTVQRQKTEELYDRCGSKYLLQASPDDDAWYGTGLLPGTVEHSGANQHYQQCCKGPRVEILIIDSGEDEDGEELSPSGTVDVYDVESVAQAMEAALSQYQNLGVTEDDCDHHATPEELLQHWTPLLLTSFPM